jgi:hypothetical protein
MQDAVLRARARNSGRIVSTHVEAFLSGGGQPSGSYTGKPLRAAPKLKPPALPGDTYWVGPGRAPARERLRLASPRPGSIFIVSTAAMHTPLPTWVIFVGSTRSRRSRHVRFAPIASEPSHRSESTRCARTRLMHRNKKNRHSITSSARAESAGGTSRPSALAVLRLIMNSNFVA